MSLQALAACNHILPYLKWMSTAIDSFFQPCEKQYEPSMLYILPICHPHPFHECQMHCRAVRNAIEVSIEVVNLTFAPKHVSVGVLDVKSVLRHA